MMLELLKLLAFAVLVCSYTQGNTMLCRTKTKYLFLFLLLFFLLLFFLLLFFLLLLFLLLFVVAAVVVDIVFKLGILVQVSGNTAICSNDIAVFWCTSDEFLFLNWEIRTRTQTSWSLFINADQPEETMNGTLNSSLLVPQVTFTNGSFINATVTIIRPINLNGSTVMCNRGMLTLNIPTRSGKFKLTIAV